MTKREKVLSVIGSVIFLGAIIFATYSIRPVTQPSLGAAGPLYRDQFNNVFLATTTIVGTGGFIIVSSSSYTPGAATYLSIVNSGSNGVSCFPIDFVNGTEATSGLTYGGGWWFAPSGGAISLDAVGMYGGTVWCLTGSGSTTLAVVAR